MKIRRFIKKYKKDYFPRNIDVKRYHYSRNKLKNIFSRKIHG
ncbi:hypothetical protein NEISICOT_00736 [Neisseria sicca ATCC 29256]|uniref:Uncharacterized protein n=2 Tax=Neisseria sicca TaxID=490 RepID=I2NKR8_NEISI|nr:hypothetical protein NEISICOT_00736 [Neisseria sicca ATCC 29256]EIG26429.1 hypothetical protein HMPREF1051_1077 [Neisseria sicca VK64]